MDLVLVFIGIVALGLVMGATFPALRRLFTRCPQCKASEVETHDDSNEFTGRTYRHMQCVSCGHQWSHRLWLQTNNGADPDQIDWPRPSEPTTDLFPDNATAPTDTTSSSDETYGGGDSGGGGAGSSW